MVMAIAFVPLQYLEEAVGALESMIPADALGLLEWLEDNYMGKCIMLYRFRTLCVCYWDKVVQLKENASF